MKLFSKGDFSQIMLPYQAFMIVQLPPKYESEYDKYSPFSNDCVFIQKFEDKADILASQAKPKKIEILCTDGNKYTVMCKPRDDLRKDALTMELNNLINRLLKRNPETRKRQLNIKTYTVVPLNHDCGLLEWISNLRSIRDILMKYYQIHRLNILTNKQLALLYPDKRIIEDVAQCVKRFKEKILESWCPPVFGEWFVQAFPDPTAWYMARLSYTKSCAVMSVVGYIIGLGDRHCENILMDSTNGGLIHVDFNLLFNKGELLDVPERVPFRLTHNMVDAMGPTGYEGIFRRTSEATLKVMRDKKEALMSVLRPFVYDPLLEWEDKTVRLQRSRENAKGKNDYEIVEVTNHKVRINIFLK